MNQITEATNELINRKLLGATVLSFGLSHQSLYLEFRNDLPSDPAPCDHALTLETEITANQNAFSKLKLLVVEEALLLFNSVNLRAITRIQCDDRSNLAIEFDGNITIHFAGIPSDEACITPWVISSRYLPVSEVGYYSVIAYRNECYSIWEPNNSTV